MTVTDLERFATRIAGLGDADVMREAEISRQQYELHVAGVPASALAIAFPEAMTTAGADYAGRRRAQGVGPRAHRPAASG